MAAAKKRATSGGRPPKDPNSVTQRRNARRTAENLSDSAKAMRDRFITEYLYDFNATQAYVRAGGTAKNAAKAGYGLRHEAYVAQRIQEAIDAMSVEAIVNQQRAVSWMAREANHFGGDSSHGARVSAIAHLMKAHQLAGVAKDSALAAKGGVMLVPPVDSDEGWEARAAAAQQRLKEEVRE